MRRTKEDAEKTKQAVITAAIRVFNRNGYAATRLVDIAQEAGTTRGAIYWHFANKFDLFAYLVDMALDEFVHIVSDSLHAEGSMLARIRHIFTTVWQHQEAHGHRFQFIEEVIFTVGTPAELLPVIEGVKQRLNRIHQLLEDEFDKAQRSGEITTAISPGDLAQVILLFFKGIGDVDDPVMPITKIQNESYLRLMFNGLNSLTRT